MRGWTVSITIQEAGRTALSETALTLPARLIRDGDSGAVALIDGAGTAHPLAQSRFDVSRQHMTLSTEADGTLLIADQSTNGVFVSQQNSARLIGKGNTMAIPAQLQVALDTVGFDIRVQSVPPRAPRADSNLHAEVRLGGKLHRVALDRAPLVVAHGALSNGFGYDRHGDLQGIIAALGNRSALVIAPDGAGQMHVFATADLGVRLNRRQIGQSQPEPVAHGTLLTFQGGHLHLMKAGADRQLACVNDACLMLNEYKPGQNCVYCGTRLGDAHTRFIG